MELDAKTTVAYLLIVRLPRLVLPIISFLMSSGGVSASTIISVTSGSNCCGAGINVSDALQVYWTQTEEFQNVSVVVPLYSWTSGVPFHVDAFLTNSTGSVTAFPPLAMSTFSAATAFGSPMDATLFSGLTLPAGKYYLTLTGSDPGGGPNGAIWVAVEPGNPTLSIATQAGVTVSAAYQANGGILDSEYAPASSFIAASNSYGSGFSNYKITVTGDAVPEPSTWLLLAGGLLFLASRQLTANSRKRDV